MNEVVSLQPELDHDRELQMVLGVLSLVNSALLEQENYNSAMANKHVSGIVIDMLVHARASYRRGYAEPVVALDLLEGVETFMEHIPEAA